MNDESNIQEIPIYTVERVTVKHLRELGMNERALFILPDNYAMCAARTLACMHQPKLDCVFRTCKVTDNAIVIQKVEKTETTPIPTP